MKKLTAKTRDTVETLLNTYSALCQAESRVGKRGHDFGLTVNNEKDDSDFVSVTIDNDIAKAALAKQKAIAAKELAKFGVAV